MSGVPAAGWATRLREWGQFAILLFATAWGVYTFVLKDIVAPAQRPTALEVAPSLEDIGGSEPDRLIRIRVACRNSTDRRIYVTALWYTVRGHRIAKRGSAPFLDEVRSAPPQTVTARDTRVIGTDVVASGRIFAGDHTVWWDPHDKTTYEYVFGVAAKHYDFLELTVRYQFTKDTTGVGPPRWTLLDDGTWHPSATVISAEGAGVELFDDLNPRHRAMVLAGGAAESHSSTTLSLWPSRRSP